MADLESNWSRRRDLTAIWHARPLHYSRALWASMLALDLLPWPWGEDILAATFMAGGLVRGSRRERALDWASHQPGRRRWRLALALCAFRGRRIARSALVGWRHPGDLRRHVIVKGDEHLARTPGAAILLGFHLGPANADVALRTTGHRLAWVGGGRVSRGWSRASWSPFLDPKEHLVPPAAERWPAFLYRARRILLDGGRIFIAAESLAGRELFHVPLSGGPLPIRAAWLTLHRMTGAPILPVLTHLEGRAQVVTIHPALPTFGSDPVDIPRLRAALASLLQDYVDQFPEQCAGIVFRSALDVR